LALTRLDGELFREPSADLAPPAKDEGLVLGSERNGHGVGHRDLGASPDGLVGQRKLVEVKCPYVGREMKIKPGKQFLFLQEVNGIISLKKTHPYYFQITGQLAITGRKSCFFIVYAFKDLFVEEVHFDETLWKNTVLPRLISFYKNHFKKYVASSL